MRFHRLGLRLYITIGSIMSFVAGWIMLAHAPKPVQPAAEPITLAAPIPTLAPLPTLNLDVSAGAPTFQSPQFQNPPAVIQQPNPSGFLPPVFQTGGS